MSERWRCLPTGPQELLLRAALLEGDSALVAWRRWKEVDGVTQTDHDSGRLFPLLCRRLLAAGVEDPDLWILKSAYRHQWLVNQQRIAAAGRALRILSAAGIETMVLKGAALALRHYKDLGARPMYDVDILVTPNRAGDAARALLAGGWSQFVPSDLEDLLRVTHGTFLRDGTDTGIDLHWYSMWAPAVEDDFWSAAEPLELAGVPTLVQCPADQLLQVCVHGIWSDGRPVRWVADAITVIRSAPGLDWDRVLEGARRRSVKPPLGEALRYLRDQFAAPVPSTVIVSLQESRGGTLARASHRIWRAPPSRRRLTWLALDRYRRLLALPPGPTREASFRRYLRCWLVVTMQLDAGRRVGPALLSSLLRRLS
jgi:hypothetical protein